MEESTHHNKTYVLDLKPVGLRCDLVKKRSTHFLLLHPIIVKRGSFP